MPLAFGQWFIPLQPRNFVSLMVVPFLGLEHSYCFMNHSSFHAVTLTHLA